jgi:O-antigen ligase
MSSRRRERQGGTPLTGIAVPAKTREFAVGASVLFVALALPNAIMGFPGTYNALHVFKYFLVGLAMVASAYLLGKQMTDREAPVDFDAVSLLWLAGGGLAVLAPLLLGRITSPWTLARESAALFGMAAVYVYALNRPLATAMPVFAWGAVADVLLNLVIAEVQISATGIPANIPGLLNSLPDRFTSYFGNVGQVNMLAEWIVIGLACGAYLYGRAVLRGKRREETLSLGALALMAYGLTATASRSGVLSGVFVVLVASVSLWVRFRETPEVRWKRSLAVMAAALLCGVALLGAAHPDRMAFIGSKARSAAVAASEGIQGDTAAGEEAPRASDTGRMSIYTISMHMIRMHPLVGVGLGHFKWNFLDAQRNYIAGEMDNYKGQWLYTMWAHNEYLQWAAEAGILGVILAKLMVLAGLWAAWKAVRSKRVSLEAAMGCWITVALLLMGVFERPFHRVEHFVWLAVGLGTFMREAIPSGALAWHMPEKDRRWAGRVVQGLAAAGFLFNLLGPAASYQLRVVPFATVKDLVNHYDAARVNPFFGSIPDKAVGDSLVDLALTKRQTTGELDREMMQAGLARLDRYFSREPQGEELYRLLNGYILMGNLDAATQYASYTDIRILAKKGQKKAVSAEETGK